MDTRLGWTFLGVALLFSLGLLPRLAARFYPGRPSVLIRLAAPVIFASLSAACFCGFAMPVLAALAVVGSVFVVLSRRRAKSRPVRSI